jgi:ATP-binding cassette subfamily B protein
MTEAASLPILQRGWLAEQSATLQQALRSHLQWFRYRTGQALLQRDRLPHQVMFIAEGSVRLVADDPATGPFTLARLGPGDALGWCGLVRGVPCETALAMEPSLVGALPAAEFLKVLRSDPALQRACREVDRSELAELLLAWLAAQPQRYRDAPGLIEALWQPGGLQVLTGAELAQPQELPADHLWLQSVPQSAPPQACSHWSGGVGTDAARLVGIRRSLLEPALHERFSQSEPGPAAGQRGYRAPQALWDVAQDAGDLPTPDELPDLGFGSSRLRLPPLRELGEGPLASAMVCLQRLASRYRFPFPRDTVQQVLLDCETRLGGISLIHLGQLLESLGLEVRPLRSPGSQLHRIEPPALIRLHDHFVLVEEASAKGLLVADPQRGLVQLSLAEVRELWPQSLELMLVRPAETPNADQEATRFDLAWFWTVMQPYRPQMVLLLITGFVDKLLELVFPLGMLQIIDVVVGSRNLSLLLPIGVVMTIAIMVMAVLGFLRQLLLSDLSDRIDTRLGSQIVGHLFRLPLKFFDRRTVGDLSSRLYDLQRVRRFLTDTAISSTLDLLFMPLLAVVLFWLQPVLGTVVVLQVPLLLLINRFSRPALKRLLTRRNRAWSRAQGFLVEVLTAIRTVKSQNFATQARWQWLERYRLYTGEDFKFSQVQVTTRELTKAVSKAMQVVLFMVAGWLAVQGYTSVGGIFAVFILSGGITGPLLNLATISNQYREAKAAMDALADVLGQQPEESISTASLLPLGPIHGEVSFERVAFSYGLDGRRQLDDFSLEIAPGQFVGLVGSSGSGKSTVVQLLDGLYRPQEGRVFVDGTDIGKVQIGSLRRQVGFVPQESILFDGTVLDNLRLNMPDAPYDAVVEAARVACAHDFIMQLPDGYNTRVGERGGALSGGQKQRIAIARMVLQNPNLVILDEATSALDPTTEFLLLERLRQRFAGRTLLVVTHRVGTLREADRILLMDQGLILEDGSWDGLMARGGAFATLATQQSSHHA